MERNLEEITEETIQLISHTLADLNIKYGHNVKIRYKDGKLTPHIDSYHKLIFFNKHLLSWLALWQIRNFTLTSDYYVAYQSFAYTYYAEAENKLSIIESNLQKLIEKNTNIKNESHNPVISYDQLLKYQVLFSIFHEYAHLLFSRDEKIRGEKVGTLKTEILSNINKKRSLRTVYNQLIQEHLKGTPWLYNIFCKLIWFPIVLLFSVPINYMQKKFYQNETRIEEMACDIWAFEELISFLDFTGDSLKKQSETLAHITKAMYCLDITYYFDNAFSQKKYNMIEVMLSTDRYVLFTKTCAAYLEKTKTGLGVFFEQKFSAFYEIERLKVFTLPSMAKQTSYLKNNRAEITEELESKLSNKITSLEQSIFDLAKNSWN